MLPITPLMISGIKDGDIITGIAEKSGRHVVIDFISSEIMIGTQQANVRFCEQL